MFCVKTIANRFLELATLQMTDELRVVDELTESVEAALAEGGLVSRGIAKVQ